MNNDTSYYTDDELGRLGFAAVGSSVQISRKSSIYRPSLISIGDNVRIDDFTILSGNIRIGNHVHIAAYVALYGSEGIDVGDFCGISARTLVYSASDDYLGGGLTGPTIPARFRKVHGGPVRFGRHVIVGAGSVVLPSVSIGEGAAIGAMALVTRSCEPWTVYAGTPAVPRKPRPSDVIRRLEAELTREERTASGSG